MQNRNVLFTNGMSSDCFLINTNAPKQEIEKWCYSYNEELKNGKNTFLDSLKATYNVEILHDSECENNNDIVDQLGYDESYDLNDYYKKMD